MRTEQSRQRRQMLKQKASEHTLVLRQKADELENQLAVKETIIAAPAEQFQSFLLRLEEHGIKYGTAPP
jgi:hypothetical protein